MPLTTDDRRRNGRKGSYVRLAKESDWTQVTEAARAAGPNSLEWHANKIDPEGQIPAEQRRKMAAAARTAWYLQLGEASRKARAARKAAQDKA